MSTTSLKWDKEAHTDTQTQFIPTGFEQTGSLKVERQQNESNISLCISCSLTDVSVKSSLG